MALCSTWWTKGGGVGRTKTEQLFRSNAGFNCVSKSENRIIIRIFLRHTHLIIKTKNTEFLETQCSNILYIVVRHYLRFFKNELMYQVFRTALSMIKRLEFNKTRTTFVECRYKQLMKPLKIDIKSF